MLTKLDIVNYRLFDELHLEGLGQVNLIAGKNNTGKTALLEAKYLDANAPAAEPFLAWMRHTFHLGGTEQEHFLLKSAPK